MGPEITCLDAIRSAEHQWAPLQFSGLLCPRKTSLCPTSQLLDKPLLLLEGTAEQPAWSVGSCRLGLAPSQWLAGLAQHQLVVWGLRVLSPGHPREFSLAAGTWSKAHALKQLISDWKSYRHTGPACCPWAEKTSKTAKTSSHCAKIPLCRQDLGKTCLIWTSTGQQLPTTPKSGAGCSPSDVQGIMKFIWTVGSPSHNSDGEILFVLLYW